MQITMYYYLSEIADRRTKRYQEFDAKLDLLTDEFGKESKEVNDFFNQIIEI